MNYFREGFKAGVKAPADCDPAQAVHELSQMMRMNRNQYYQFYAGFTYGIASASSVTAARLAAWQADAPLREKAGRKQR